MTAPATGFDLCDGCDRTVSSEQVWICAHGLRCEDCLPCAHCVTECDDDAAPSLDLAVRLEILVHLVGGPHDGQRLMRPRRFRAIEIPRALRGGLEELDRYEVTLECEPWGGPAAQERLATIYRHVGQTDPAADWVGP